MRESLRLLTDIVRKIWHEIEKLKTAQNKELITFKEVKASEIDNLSEM